MILKEEGLNDREYLLFTANLLFAFGTAGIKLFDNFKDINVLDANIIEVAYMKYPENVFLASILQSHALIKWSESLSK